MAFLIQDFDFQVENAFTVEMGCGNGQFLNQLAVRHPERLFIGIDRKKDRLSKSCGEALQIGLKNVRYVHGLIENLPGHIRSDSVEEVWVQFPDPHPKPSRSGRRLIHPYYIQFYHQILISRGKLHFKTDNENLFNFALESIPGEQLFEILEISRNSGENDRYDDGGIQTKYETIWRKKNLTIYYIQAIRC